MKYCAKCNNSYNDDTLAFCLECGSPLMGGSFSSEAKTEVMNQPVTANVQSKPTVQQQNIYTQQPISTPQYPSGTAGGELTTLPTKARLLSSIVSLIFTIGSFALFFFALLLVGLKAVDEAVAGFIVIVALFVMPPIGTLFGLIAVYRAFRSNGGNGSKGFAIIAIILNVICIVSLVGLLALGAINNYMEGKL